jgi:hypothetical protein
MTTSQSNAAAVVASYGHGDASAPGSAPKATAAFTLSHKEARLLDLLVSLAAGLLQPNCFAFGYLISVHLPHISLLFSANELLHLLSFLLFLFFCLPPEQSVSLIPGSPFAFSTIARSQSDPSY